MTKIWFPKDMHGLKRAVKKHHAKDSIIANEVTFKGDFAGAEIETSKWRHVVFTQCIFINTNPMWNGILFDYRRMT
jgi:hypothetical protein